MCATRKINFNAGPSRLPEPVLQRLQAHVGEYEGAGMSILEMSHRSPQVMAIVEQTKERLTRLLGIPEGYGICFMPGGASMQFINIPLNFLAEGKVAAYVNTGVWSKKAIAEAKKFGDVAVVASSEEQGFFAIPAGIQAPDNAAYLHITSNNTIFGTQYKTFPQTAAPLVADMSSDILSKPLPVEQFAMIYAGVQKNLGPAGAALIIANLEFLETARPNLPSMQDYKLIIEQNSLYNTPPVFQILAVNETLGWIESLGGLEKIAEMNEEKGRMLYGAIDANPEFFKCPLENETRSLMNVPFRLPTEELEQQFIAAAAERDMVGIKGHRSVGGIRISMYNALLPDELKVLCAFMAEFAQQNA